MSFQINRFHQDKWKAYFSNLPTLQNGKIDMALYDQYVKSVILPDYTIETAPTMSFKGATLNPVSMYNFNQTILTVEFKISENAANYFYMYEWLEIVRYNRKTKGIKNLKDTTIKSIDIQFLNNEKNPIGKFRFTNAIITNLGSVSLSMGVADEVTFACSFEYEECKLVREDD